MAAGDHLRICAIRPHRIICSLNYSKKKQTGHHYGFHEFPPPGKEAGNRNREILDAGFSIEPRRIIAETASGSAAMAHRKGFSRLLEKMEKGGLSAAAKLDRLGRDAIDVGMTVEKLGKAGIRVHWLALGAAAPASSAGRAAMNVINSVARSERSAH